MRIKKTSQYIEGGAGLPSYFTDEIKTGEFWIDGKPIYRKVIEYTNSSTWGTSGGRYEANIPHNISNLGQLISWNLTNETNQIFPRADGTTSVTTWTGISGINSTNVVLRIINDTWSPRKWIVTLEYTKTTD